MRHPSELLYPIGKVICIDVRRCEHYLLEYWLSCARATIASSTTAFGSSGA